MNMIFKQKLDCMIDYLIIQIQQMQKKNDNFKAFINPNSLDNKEKLLS